MRTHLAAACLLAVLSGCVKDEAAVSVRPPPSLLSPCADPVAIPARDLTGAEVEILWGRDRSALRECGGKVEGLAEVL